MVADRITFGVFALDQVQMPKPSAAKGWAARLAETCPTLRDGATCTTLILADAAEQPVLAEDLELSDTKHPAGSSVAVEPVEGRAGLYLIRIGGKVSALASSVPWPEGEAHPVEAAEAPQSLAAFGFGTVIDTPDGPRAAQTLQAGDMVTTLANGSRPLRWVGRRRVDPVELLAHPGLRPVEFAAGTVGNTQRLLVSAQQRMLIDDWRAAVYFGEDRVLVAAQALVDDQSARLLLPAEGVDYAVLLCDRHEVLLAEGALSESFHPGTMGFAALTKAARAEIAAIVPEAELIRRRAAYPIVRNAEARALRQ